METKHLRTFITVVDLKSFTAASRRLGSSQSAISQQIGALERQLGTRLLKRTGSGARPTAAGEVLVQYARQILRKVDEAQRMLGDYDSSPSGLLRIGAGGAACHYLLPAVLKEFRDAFPKLELHVLSGHTRLTVERLLADELDLGLVTLPVPQERLQLMSVGHDELVAIVHPGHPWAGRPRIAPRELANQPLLLYERRSQTFHLIERVLLEAGVLPRIDMEMDHLEAVVEMVRVGLGVAIVPQWTVRAEIEQRELVALRIGKAGLVRGCALAFLEEGKHREPLRKLLRLCAERLPAVLAA